jgi:hypothetical protein
MRLEREVAYALLTRATQGLTLLAAAACVAWRFSLGQQGLFFVFLSLGALIQVSEFGTSYAVLQVGARLRDDAARLEAFRLRARRLQFTLMGVAALAVGLLGAGLFSPHAAPDEAGWPGPWFAFAAAVAAAQWIALEVAFVEAASSATAAWRLRWLQESIGGAAFVGALLAGAGLWSLALSVAVRAAVGVAGLRRRPAAAVTPVPSAIRWRQDIWPFQWRIGMSTAVGFLIFQAVNPVVMFELGSAEAGRFGLGLAIMNMLLQVSSAWPLSQAARFSRLIHAGEFVELRARFRRVLALSTMLAVAMAACALVAHGMLAKGGFGLTSRLPPVSALGALVVAGLGHHVTLCLAVLLRAEQREPLLKVTVFGGLFSLVVVWLAARAGGTAEVAYAHLACTVLGLGIAIVHYRRFTSRLPAPGDAPTRRHA